MDNQASRVIKEYLTLQKCNLMLVKPNIYRVNATKRAIQTFSALHKHASDDRQQVPIATLGPTDPTSGSIIEHA
jgi:hypothetical protein